VQAQETWLNLFSQQTLLARIAIKMRKFRLVSFLLTHKHYLNKIVLEVWNSHGKIINSFHRLPHEVFILCTTYGECVEIESWKKTSHTILSLSIKHKPIFILNIQFKDTIYTIYVISIWDIYLIILITIILSTKEFFVIDLFYLSLLFPIIRYLQLSVN